MSATQTTPTFHTTLRYTNRASKAAYIAAKYAPILTHSVLDVGCDRKQLKDHLPSHIAYTGIDMNDSADLVLDLESASLPFPSRGFQTVIAADVLEHIDHLHALFDELCRVTNRYLIISLPNPYRNFILDLFKNNVSALKYYGLPSSPPPDRHRWFFGADDVKAFMETQAPNQGFRILQLDAEVVGFPPNIGNALPAMAHSFHLGADTLWTVLERQ